jgi:GTPase SAR1 family protein
MGAIGVLIIGESGSGKSTSIRNLDRNSTGIINIAGKRLPFKGNEFKMINTDNVGKIISLMKNCKANKLVIDDFQYVILNEFMLKAKQKGFDKFTEMAFNYWSIIKTLDGLNDKLIVYFLSHIDRDQFGNEHAKTCGKLLEEKIVPEGMFSICLKTVVKNNNYFFSTQNNGQDTVKSPLGMFENDLIPNDLAYVDHRIREYYGIS